MGKSLQLEVQSDFFLKDPSSELKASVFCEMQLGESRSLSTRCFDKTLRSGCTNSSSTPAGALRDEQSGSKSIREAPSPDPSTLSPMPYTTSSQSKRSALFYTACLFYMHQIVNRLIMTHVLKWVTYILYYTVSLLPSLGAVHLSEDYVVN